MTIQYAKKVLGSKPNLELSHHVTENLHFEKLCHFVRRVLNCHFLNTTDRYWSDVCGVSERWVRAWKGGKRVHIKHIEKILAELPALVEKSRSQVDDIKAWGERMSFMLLIRSIKDI